MKSIQLTKRNAISTKFDFQMTLKQIIEKKQSILGWKLSNGSIELTWSSGKKVCMKLCFNGTAKYDFDYDDNNNQAYILFVELFISVNRNESITLFKALEFGTNFVFCK